MKWCRSEHRPVAAAGAKVLSTQGGWEKRWGRGAAVPSHTTVHTTDTTDAADQAGSTFFVVWPTSARFGMHSGNMYISNNMNNE